MMTVITSDRTKTTIRRAMLITCMSFAALVSGMIYISDAQAAGDTSGDPGDPFKGIGSGPTTGSPTKFGGTGSPTTGSTGSPTIGSTGSTTSGSTGSTTTGSTGSTTTGSTGSTTTGSTGSTSTTSSSSSTSGSTVVGKTGCAAIINGSGYYTPADAAHIECTSPPCAANFQGPLTTCILEGEDPPVSSPQWDEPPQGFSGSGSHLISGKCGPVDMTLTSSTISKVTGIAAKCPTALSSFVPSGINGLATAAISATNINLPSVPVSSLIPAAKCGGSMPLTGSGVNLGNLSITTNNKAVSTGISIISSLLGGSCSGSTFSLVQNAMNLVLPSTASPIDLANGTMTTPPPGSYITIPSGSSVNLSLTGSSSIPIELPEGATIPSPSGTGSITIPPNSVILSLGGGVISINGVNYNYGSQASLTLTTSAVGATASIPIGSTTFNYPSDPDAPSDPYGDDGSSTPETSAQQAAELSAMIAAAKAAGLSADQISSISVEFPSLTLAEQQQFIASLQSGTAADATTDSAALYAQLMQAAQNGTLTTAQEAELVQELAADPSTEDENNKLAQMSTTLTPTEQEPLLQQMMLLPPDQQAALLPNVEAAEQNANQAGLATQVQNQITLLNNVSQISTLTPTNQDATLAQLSQLNSGEQLPLTEEMAAQLSSGQQSELLSQAETLSKAQQLALLPQMETAATAAGENSLASQIQAQITSLEKPVTKPAPPITGCRGRNCE